MAINISDKVLSIPPYVSTNWSRIAALHMKGGVLAITLVDGDTIHIPGMSTEHINLIFQFHAKYLEKEHITSNQDEMLKESLNFPVDEMGLKKMMDQMNDSSIRFAFGPTDGMGYMVQHNPSQHDAPDLPPEVLQKIGAIFKILAPMDEAPLQPAEANCKCFHCQISRAINSTSLAEGEDLEEVALEELQFQEWSIIQTGEQLFSVINRLDSNEKYSVFLGNPVGCTCGKEGCEHILAVLKS